ncbi:hypothetical protein ABZ318_21460 [Streptomyces sp. NPDC006197]|uniref:hypothetical protein n=1 Tax=Streptomyces sp. NPDC006197 TaxID=3156685 RepID=UPI0033BB78B3
MKNAEYPARFKAGSEFAVVPPEKTTPERRQEPAARYNGGPYGQACGRGFAKGPDDAKGALQ